MKISRNAILFAVAMTIVLCGCSTAHIAVRSSSSDPLHPQLNVDPQPPRSASKHAHRGITLQFTKEF